jgi:hypothetical protein
MSAASITGRSGRFHIWCWRNHRNGLAMTLYACSYTDRSTDAKRRRMVSSSPSARRTSLASDAARRSPSLMAAATHVIGTR